VRTIGKLIVVALAVVIVIAVPSYIFWDDLIHWWDRAAGSARLASALAVFGTLVSVISAVAGFFHQRLYSRLGTIQDKLGGEWQDLWLLHNPRAYVPKKRWLREPERVADRDQKRICIFNQKGGVGKTTLAINLAAYFDQREKKTLLIDLDYQGSLSEAMLSTIGIDVIDPNVDRLFSDPEPTETEIINREKSLGPELSKTCVITASLEFERIENKLMTKWLVADGYRDIRHILAKAVPKMGAFDVIIFDCPPRLTTGTVNALCAATHVLIPTVLNPMSVRAVAPTLGNLRKLTDRLNPKIRLLGVVGNLTRQSVRNTKENIQFQLVADLLHKDAEPDAQMFDRTLPRREILGQGDAVAYLGTKQENKDFRLLFDELGDELSKQLWPKDKLDEAMLEAAE
jgi:cellulose biosynthesis protein BcsQ